MFKSSLLKYWWHEPFPDNNIPDEEESVVDISLEEEVGVYALGPGPLPLHDLQDTAQVTKALNPKSRQVLINRRNKWLR